MEVKIPAFAGMTGWGGAGMTRGVGGGGNDGWGDDAGWGGG